MKDITITWKWFRGEEIQGEGERIYARRMTDEGWRWLPVVEDYADVAYAMRTGLQIEWIEEADVS